MKLKFKYQDFQQQAVSAVTDLFCGQERGHRLDELSPFAELSLFDNNFIVANSLSISPQQIVKNMHAVQRRNNLPLTSSPTDQFTIEMETGTGKTYVYTKTIYELYKQYGFSKFIIVVPSIAVREGVLKSLETTSDHFSTQYEGIPCHFFRFASDHLSDARQFATSYNIEIMVITIDAFKRNTNKINRAQDILQGQTALTYLRKTNPIVIIDEPQSVDNTDKAQNAIATLEPLFILRYSATHRQKINLIYRLSPVTAYKLGLVKRICVCAPEHQGVFNGAHLRFVNINANAHTPKARLELDLCDSQGRVHRRTINVKEGSDLYELSGKREIYRGLKVSKISYAGTHSDLELSDGNILPLTPLSSDYQKIQRAQIKRTIATHLDKELELNDKGLKVLSLFFIDEVSKYRTSNGSPGPYAIMFDSCYRELLEDPRYRPLKQKYGENISSMHNGYFSQDNKGGFKNTRGDTQLDNATYNAIMRDKEWLLSLQCPLRFIFSHSALKEGWDNPNIFQVCTLIEQKSPLTCRQKIGRGLRLCVNQDGERIEDRDINILHVIANESFSEFATTLQTELEQENGQKFDGLNLEILTSPEVDLDIDRAQYLWNFWRKHGYIDGQGKLKSALSMALYHGELELPPNMENRRCALEQMLSKVCYCPLINEREEHLKNQETMSKYSSWHALWKQVYPNIRYRLSCEEQSYIDSCAQTIAKLPPLESGRIVFQSAELDINNTGVRALTSIVERNDISIDISNACKYWPDILSELGQICSLKRATVNSILERSQRLEDWKANPQLFLERCAGIMRSERQKLILRGLSLWRNNWLDSYTMILRDSATIRNEWFDVAERPATRRPQIYRLPPKFPIDTPWGTIYPRWAIHLLSSDIDEIHFVSPDENWVFPTLNNTPHQQAK